MTQFDFVPSKISLSRFTSLVAALGLFVGVVGCAGDEAEKPTNNGATGTTNQTTPTGNGATLPDDKSSSVASDDSKQTDNAGQTTNGTKPTQPIGEPTTEQSDPIKPTDNGKTANADVKPASPQNDAQRAARNALAKKWAAVNEDVNRLKQIAIAFHNYHETYRSFGPSIAVNPAYFDENGKAKVSWRVHLLPFLEQFELYQQFKLDEPWDSPNNKPLLAKMPDIYRAGDDEGSKTRFVGFVDTNKDKADQITTAFPRGKQVTIANITDGTSNTLFVVKAPKDKSVNWTAPDDFAFDSAKPEEVAAAFAKEELGVMFALMDGSVQMLKSEIPAETLANLINPTDGNVVSYDDLIVKRPSPYEFFERKTGPVHLAYMHPRAVAVCVVHPKAIMESAIVKALLTDEVANTLLSEIPFDIKSIEEVTVWVVPDIPFRPAYFAVRTVDGKAMEALRNIPTPTRSFVHDEKTLLFAPEEILMEILSPETEGNDILAKLVGKEVPQDHVSAIVAMRHPMIAQFTQPQMLAQLPLPPNLADERVLGVISKLESIRLSLDLSGELIQNLTFVLSDAESAGTFKTFLSNGLETAKAQLAEAPLSAAEVAILKPLVAGVTVESKDAQVSILLKANDEIKKQIAVAFSKVVEDAQKAAQRSARMNTLKQIGLAFHNYRAAFNQFAPATNPKSQDKDGKSHLSWRVHLLPMLDQAALYRKFNLEEPWDSEQNKPLLNQMPDLFKTPGVEKEGHTSLLTFTGENTPFNGGAGPKIQSISDGTSNTILVVEAGADKAVPWTKPTDLEVDLDDPLKALGNVVDRFQALFMDGSVKGIPLTIQPETLKALITPAGGEVVDDF